MNKQRFEGTGVALVTPFLNQEVDYPALAGLIEHVINGGVDYIVALGTTGEAITLSSQECREVFDYILEKVNNRIPVVAGFFGSNNTARLTNATREYNLDGFAGIMASSPAYNKPPQEGIYQHFMALADASPIPIIIYNVPGRTSSMVQAETILRLAESSEKFAAVKEASGNLGQAMTIAKYKPDSLTLLSGEDPLTLPIMACGGRGVISVIANATPRILSNMIKAALKGDFEEARALHFQLLDVHPWLYVDGNPAGIKAALEMMGLCRREVRLPLTELTEPNRIGLKKALEQAGCLSELSKT